MNVLAYGSLLFPEVLEALTGSRFESEDLILRHFQRRTLRGEIYPGLIEHPGGAVDCRLWFDVDAESMEILDRFEDRCYERRIIPIETRSRGAAEALFYVIPRSLAGVLSDEPWEPGFFKQNHLRPYVEMCRKFRAETIAAIVAKL